LIGVTISACFASSSDVNGDVQAYVYSSLPVDTNVSVSLRWEGDLAGVDTGTATILSGDSCAAVLLTGSAVAGENASLTDITLISPASSSTQTYNTGSAFPSGSCTTC
jgi:hypothetical protein